jgi:hypothetical protein
MSYNEELEDTKELNRIWKLKKDRQYNDQKKSDKRICFWFCILLAHIAFLFSILCCVYACCYSPSCVLRAQYHQCLWIGHYWFSIRFSLTINVISKYFFAQQWRLSGRYEWISVYQRVNKTTHLLNQ